MRHWLAHVVLSETGLHMYIQHITYTANIIDFQTQLEKVEMYRFPTCSNLEMRSQLVHILLVFSHLSQPV